MTSKISLDDDQKFALMKFRRSVNDILQSHHDDNFLLRWLRARQWNPEAAEKMLRLSMQWRQQWEVDTALKTWTPSETLTLYHPSGTCGFDKDGCPDLCGQCRELVSNILRFMEAEAITGEISIPLAKVQERVAKATGISIRTIRNVKSEMKKTETVIVIPFSGLDIVGLLHSVSRQDLVRFTIQVLEKNMSLAAETGTNQLVAIFDMDGFNLRQYAWRPAAEVVISLIQMYEANYPEILKACYIINAPRVFAIAFNVVKKFLNDYTLGKIKIFKSDPKKWKAAVLENITPDNLPKYLGGNLTDPDGNPKYATVVKQGGKVPKSYYTKNLQVPDTTSSQREHTTTVIKKGDKLTLDFIVADDDCYLRWDFKTDGHDIRFGVTLKDADGKTSPVVRHRRVAAHQIPESGVLACQAPATYTVTFDNSYSLLRSKKIHYCVYVTLPLEKLNILPPDQSSESEKPVDEDEKNNNEDKDSKKNCASTSVNSCSVSSNKIVDPVS